MKRILQLLAAGCLTLPGVVFAGELNLATLSCDAYENQILNAAPGAEVEDALNVSMWLFGFTVARTGEHAIYSNGLQAVGNALDGACKAQPSSSLLTVLATVNPANASPMDLKELECATFVRRHEDLYREDADSARTIMMWLYGFHVGKTGGHILDSAAGGVFTEALLARCREHPRASLFDTLTAVRMPKK